jgi:hypothetical protein
MTAASRGFRANAHWSKQQIATTLLCHPEAIYCVCDWSRSRKIADFQIRRSSTRTCSTAFNVTSTDEVRALPTRPAHSHYMEKTVMCD